MVEGCDLQGDACLTRCQEISREIMVHTDRPFLPPFISNTSPPLAKRDKHQIEEQMNLYLPEHVILLAILTSAVQTKMTLLELSWCWGRSSYMLGTVKLIKVSGMTSAPQNVPKQFIPEFIVDYNRHATDSGRSACIFHLTSFSNSKASSKSRTFKKVFLVHLVIIFPA